jgi:hypothetical protein
MKVTIQPKILVILGSLQYNEKCPSGLRSCSDSMELYIVKRRKQLIHKETTVRQDVNQSIEKTSTA